MRGPPPRTMLQASLLPAELAGLELEGKAGADDDGLPKTTTTAVGAPIDASLSAMRVGGDESDGAGGEKGEQEEGKEEVGAAGQSAGGVSAAVGLPASATGSAEEQDEEREREAVGSAKMPPTKAPPGAGEGDDAEEKEDEEKGDGEQKEIIFELPESR